MDNVLRQALEEIINKAEFYGETMRPTWGVTRFKFVQFCLYEKIVSEEELAIMAKARLLSWGRKNYEWLFLKGHFTKWPDHAPCRSALAFAIREGELTEVEIARIKFDHGDTAETFVTAFINDIISRTVIQFCQLEPLDIRIAS